MRVKSHEGAPGAGRANQKARTRQALQEAARALLAEGQAPTLARAAARALVSEATAYRYYPDARSLLREAFAPGFPDLDAVLAELRTLPTAAARAQRAAEAMARTVLAHEAAIRALIAMSYAPGEVPQAVARPSFRTLLIEAVLEAVAPSPDAAGLRRLRLALSAVISAEAVLALKDGQACGDGEIGATLGWLAAQACASSATALPKFREKSRA